MKIGIIGAGNIGGTLSRRLTQLGHQVTVANSRGAETLADLAAETGATAGTPQDAVRGADLVVTVPQKSVSDLPRDLFAGAPDDLVVVDTGNYYPQQRDGAIPALEQGTPESVWVGEQLGQPVIKAFNGIPAQDLLERGVPAGTDGRIALPVAGDDERAKTVVLQLVEDLGFTAVDAGPLAQSWRQQPGTPSYGAQNDPDALRAALAAASPGRPADFRA